MHSPSDSQSASAHTMHGFLPPSSSVTLFRLLREAASLTSFPTFRATIRLCQLLDVVSVCRHALGTLVTCLSAGLMYHTVTQPWFTRLATAAGHHAR